MTEGSKGGVVPAAPPATLWSPSPEHPDTIRCDSASAHPTHVWFPIGDFPKRQLICPGAIDLGPWLTGPIKPARKPVNARDKGLNAERHLANWCGQQGWPDARRSVSTGWATKGRKHQDQGDIAGTPGLCFQLKNYADEEPGPATLDKWMAATEAQAGSDRLPLLVVKRNGHASPGMWHLWLRARDLAHLLTGMPPELVTSRAWVRATLGQLVGPLLDYSRTHDQEGTS